MWSKVYKKSLMARAGFVIFLLSPTFLVADDAEFFSGQDPESVREEYFNYGMPCAKLVEINYSEFLALIHPSHREFFNSFCLPENVYTCSDYNGLLYQQGVLENTSGPMCEFIPSPDSSK